LDPAAASGRKARVRTVTGALASSRLVWLTPASRIRIALHLTEAHFYGSALLSQDNF
jgi:hypothetical protein